MSIAPAHRDNDGSKPCLPPHILGRLLDKLRAKIGNEQQEKPDPWAGIDRLARDIKATR
jgi:hypothetical protein